MAEAGPLPQFYSNNLPLVKIEHGELDEVRNILRSAVSKGLAQILSECPAQETKDGGSIFSGDRGIAYAFNRILRQSSALEEGDEPFLTERMRSGIEPRIGPFSHALERTPGRLATLGGGAPTLASAFLRTLAGDITASDDGRLLLEALDFATSHPIAVELNGRQMGMDDIIRGRTGLLSAILETKNYADMSNTPQKALGPVYAAVPQLVNAIVDAGRKGAEEHVKKYGTEAAMPLMWRWIDDFVGLGAAHGAAGILAVLVDPRLVDLYPAITSVYTEIGETINRLCELCMENDGDLAMSVPPFPSKRDSPLFQICHGAPGLLLLLACARKTGPFKEGHWNSTMEKATECISETVWARGLLSKGGGICHGIAGNALAQLMLYKYSDKSTEIYLSRGLAMLLECRETPPFSTENSGKYRLPDCPYSLWEGLAGIVCAWAEACVILMGKIRVLQLEKNNTDHENIGKDDDVVQWCSTYRMGFPNISGFGD